MTEVVPFIARDALVVALEGIGIEVVDASVDMLDHVKLRLQPADACYLAAVCVVKNPDGPRDVEDDDS